MFYVPTGMASSCFPDLTIKVNYYLNRLYRLFNLKSINYLNLFKLIELIGSCLFSIRFIDCLN